MEQRAQLVRIVLLAAWLVVRAGGVWAAPQKATDIETLIRQVGERLVEYYRRAQTVVCVERSTVQPIQWNWSFDGLARTVESDLRVDLDATDGDELPDAQVVREIRRINGREPRERDKKDRSGCTDPNPLSPEPLAFLLPTHRGEYRFTSIHEDKEKDAAALVVDFVSTVRKSRPELIEDERGHDDCFDWTGPVATRGRVWVDASTREVLRVDRRIDGPIDVRVPWKIQRRYNLPAWVVLERDDLSMRYKPVAFTDPEEVILLPESIESLTVIRSGLQSVRRTETYSNYRRFLTTGRVVK
ncbi:MAG TPA: hypothetical protein VH458_09675 [Vicinamibacterales bacterium]|jgi:hypothetical protein